MQYYRVTSNYLPDADSSEYLVNRLPDIADVCSTSIPDITLRALPTYNPISTTTRSPTSAAPVVTCLGKTISSASAPVRCDTISTAYGVTTGDIQSSTNSDTCAFSSSICLPTGCGSIQTKNGYLRLTGAKRAWECDNGSVSQLESQCSWALRLCDSRSIRLH
jgi:hypothetical protein